MTLKEDESEWTRVCTLMSVDETPSDPTGECSYVKVDLTVLVDRTDPEREVDQKVRP